LRRNAGPVYLAALSFRVPQGSAAATFVVLAVWALGFHPWLGPATATTPTNTTTTVSTTTSSETVTTTETVRVDIASTRLVVIDPLGAVVSDQTFSVPFADAAVQSAVATGTTALQTGSPESLFVKGPTLAETTTALVDSSTETTETGRMDDQTLTQEEDIGPTCIGTGNRDVPNTSPCASCANTTVVPPRGTPFCVASGTSNINFNLHTHTTINELATTTETYETTERYVLRGGFVDHFLFYKTKTSKGAAKLVGFGPVTLTDALGAADYDVVKLPALGLPADKNAEGDFDATTHLAQYAVKRRKVSGKFQKLANVTTQNQCGPLTLTLTKPDSLLVTVARQTAPFDPLSAEVDHFLCYKAKSTTKLAKGTQVDVADDFQTRRYDLKKPTRLCIPTSTDGTPTTKKGVAVPIVATARRHPAGHLVCYQAKIASKIVAQNGCGPIDPKSKGTKIEPKPAKHQKQLGVAITGPLGAATLDTAKEVELCIPSTASLP